MTSERKNIMPRTLLLALAFLTATSAAHAQGTQPKWEGTLRFTSQTPACNGKFKSADNDRAEYHPQLFNQGQVSSFTRFGNGETELIYLIANGQFQGSGQYVGMKISDGLATGIGGTYSFAQSPANVTNATLFVSLKGTLRQYNNVRNCDVTIQGIFVRLEP